MEVTSSIPLPELISMAKLKKNAPIRDRLRAVIYALQNDTAEEIALQLDRPVSWVQVWVYRYRDHGIEGLNDLPRSGKPPKLTPHELTQFIVRVLEGPQKSDEVFAFVGRDFQKILLEEFRTEYSLSGVYKLLHSIGFSSLMPRPRHEKNDPKVMEEWLKEAPRFIRQLKKKKPEMILQIWFMDEMRFGMKGVLKRIWALRGSRPTQIKQQGFKSGYVFGAVNPQTGNRVGLVFSNVDTETVNLFLKMTSEAVAKDVHIILVMDNAGYHVAKEMKVPENMTILPLPPYSPELNPVERLWHWMRGQYLCNRVFKNMSQILEAGCDAWNKLTDSLVQSICAVSWLSDALRS